MQSEADVRDLFFVNLVDDRQRALIVRAQKILSKARRMIEVPRLEAEPHHGAKRGGRFRTRHPLPEPIAHREAADRETCMFHVFRVKVRVAHFVLGDLAEAAQKGGGRLGEAHDRPGHQFGRLELVMEKAVKKLGAARRVGEGPLGFRLLRLRFDDEFRRPPGAQIACLGATLHRRDCEVAGRRRPLFCEAR